MDTPTETPFGGVAVYIQRTASIRLDLPRRSRRLQLSIRISVPHNPLPPHRQLVILTSSYPQKDPNGTWFFPPGEFPRDIDWIGSNNQVRSEMSIEKAVDNDAQCQV